MFSWTFVQNETGSLLTGRFTGNGEQIHDADSHSCKQITAFDLDSTLIDTKSGELHAVDAADWRWWHPTVPIKLRSLYSQGHTLIIFTNQGRLTTITGIEAPESQIFKAKVEAMAQELGVPLTVYAACANDLYRKPRTGMWDTMCVDFGLREVIQQGSVWKLMQKQGDSVISAVLVGDAAGRENDHSDSDRHFCENLGIQFLTPEEFFLGDETQVLGHKFDPRNHLPPNLGGFSSYTPHKRLRMSEVHFAEMMILVGLPGAGKTTYYKKFLQPLGYGRVNGDESGSLEKSIQAAEQLLLDETSVVIDDINSDLKTRQTWIEIAKKYEIQVRAFNFTTPSDLCLHNDAVRALGGPLMNLENREISARTPFMILQSNFQSPQKGEGYKEVVDIDFEWAGSDEQLQIWGRHWL